ncbi:hypothetical protein P5673_024062 [Acropora cervicornis]|uniref:IRS-type PTB domain-containing protein n=1 Tax=Acropora cervicornis TaxID=6130 RepID=A0AAD9Q4T1_ACRCE|nr:hypothetical protein P5673_024062 [Acropora cervicornis]
MASYVEDLIWKRKWFVLRRKSPRGQARLEYYLSEKACSEGRHRTSVSLEDLTSVSKAHSRTHDFSFLLVGVEIKLFLRLYEVNVIRTEDSDRLQLEGNYLMTVRKEYLCLHCARTGKRVLEWELDHLPRFRLQRLSHLQDLDKVLTFQAASRCKTREGHFQFLTQQGREILECVKLQTQRLASLRHLQQERQRRPSLDSVPCTRSSENETVDSLTSTSFS